LRSPHACFALGMRQTYLESRCTLLRHSGYEAQASTLQEAEILLRTEKYDLVIISAWLSEWEGDQILPAAVKLPPMFCVD
jgi:DNA-binding response OmpR family regulator